MCVRTMYKKCKHRLRSFCSQTMALQNKNYFISFHRKIYENLFKQRKKILHVWFIKLYKNIFLGAFMKVVVKVYSCVLLSNLCEFCLLSEKYFFGHWQFSLFPFLFNVYLPISTQHNYNKRPSQKSFADCFFI
jgi:hypothetical protein